MAIQQEPQIQVLTTQTEVASSNINLSRDVVDNENGTVSEIFGCKITPAVIVYTVDTNNTRTGIQSNTKVADIFVSPEQLNQLFGIQITLADGTKSVIGEVMSSFADQLIALQGNFVGTITTQAIDIQALISLQAQQAIEAQQQALVIQDAINQAANALLS